MSVLATQNFYDLNARELEVLCRTLSISTVHVNTLIRGIYKQGEAPSQTGKGLLPNALRKHLLQNVQFALPEIHAAHISRYDDSVKLVLKLHDGQFIESVLMPETARITLCVSSQVGCKRACSFCHTGRMGLKRNLSASEIVGQVVVANRWMLENSQWLVQRPYTQKRVTNIVFMGMGEPLDNFDSLIKSIEILMHPNGLNMGPRKISVSTSGHLEGLRKLRAIFPQIPIAISLHATNERVRRQLMPITRDWPLQEILTYIDELVSTKKHKNPLIQYTMIKGVNDKIEDAEKLVEFFAGKDIKVNLIPFNTVEPSQFSCPEAETIQAFRDVLHKGRVRSLVRYSKGQDINAACGQLVDKSNLN